MAKKNKKRSILKGILSGLVGALDPLGVNRLAIEGVKEGSLGKLGGMAAERVLKTKKQKSRELGPLPEMPKSMPLPRRREVMPIIPKRMPARPLDESNDELRGRLKERRKRRRRPLPMPDRRPFPPQLT